MQLRYDFRPNNSGAARLFRCSKQSIQTIQNHHQVDFKSELNSHHVETNHKAPAPSVLIHYTTYSFVPTTTVCIHNPLSLIFQFSFPFSARRRHRQCMSPQFHYNFINIGIARGFRPFSGLVGACSTAIGVKKWSTKPWKTAHFFVRPLHAESGAGKKSARQIFIFFTTEKKSLFVLYARMREWGKMISKGKQLRNRIRCRNCCTPTNCTLPLVGWLSVRDIRESTL